MRITLSEMIIAKPWVSGMMILIMSVVQATEHCVTLIINSLYFVCFNLIIS